MLGYQRIEFATAEAEVLGGLDEPFAAPRDAHNAVGHLERDSGGRMLGHDESLLGVVERQKFGGRSHGFTLRWSGARRRARRDHYESVYIS